MLFFINKFDLLKFFSKITTEKKIDDVGFSYIVDILYMNKHILKMRFFMHFNYDATFIFS